MKNAKREVVERCVSLNKGELECLRELAYGLRENATKNGVAPAARHLVDRLLEKLGRALSPRSPRHG